MDDMGLGLKDVAGIRIGLGKVEADVHCADSNGNGDDRQCDHVRFFSLVNLRLAVCGYDDSVAIACHDALDV